MALQNPIPVYSAGFDGGEMRRDSPVPAMIEGVQTNSVAERRRRGHVHLASGPRG